ncbi:uncharacterized protein LOC114937127 [Nylanderia fulva]|uniref:uncharacterized protein LOC114937127 n=1 Tax=Nylanderia fulva TaxID=613905 RepID=UPI0010FB9D5C|nr:uncharacterized protein LOC114937127 [Nylanderia fulva]
MYSESTDFNSEESVDTWSPKRTIIDDNRDDTTSYLVHEFGDLVDHHGWIQCHSKTYPDRVYFHNMHSNCNTWYRPISRYIDIPSISIRKVFHRDDGSAANNIELLSVSDNEKESAASVADDDRSTVIPDVVARYYYTPQVDLTSDVDDLKSSPDRSPSVDAFVNEYLYDKEKDINGNNVDEGIGDERNSSEMECATNFLETEFFVGDGEVNLEKINRVINFSMNDDEISSATTLSTSAIEPYVVYGVPRLKKISLEDQLIKQRRTRVSNRVEKGPKKIICDMYGVKTINYDLPTQDQVQAQVGVKSSTLSESDSDVSEPPPSRNVKTLPLFESEWCDIEKNLHQPLLSDPSSSPSSRSDTNNSSTCWSTSSTTSSTCSVCSTCTEKSMS